MRRRILLGAGWLFPLILVVLFFMKGQHYDPSFFEPPNAELFALPIPSTVGVWILEDAQSLPADRMFEKINGKSGYYLQYGAIGLCSGEWVANGQRWDMYLYHFEDGQGARGAYMGERPSDGVALEGIEGYTVPGQAVLVAGSFYLQLNAQTAKADVVPAVELALALVPHLGGENAEPSAETVIDLAALAADAKKGDAEQFLPESAFGFSVLNQVRTIGVSLDHAEAVWFTTPGNAETVAAYAEELALYGGENRFNHDQGSGGSMFGSWGFVGVLNGAVWGIHDAPSREALLQHWNELKQRVEGL